MPGCSADTTTPRSTTETASTETASTETASTETLPADGPPTAPTAPTSTSSGNPPTNRRWLAPAQEPEGSASSAQMSRRMPDAVARRAAMSRITAMAIWGPVRPLVSESARHMLQAPPSRNPPRTSRTTPKSTELQRALGGRDVGDAGVQRNRGAQCPGERLELALDDVMGVPTG